MQGTYRRNSRKNVEETKEKKVEPTERQNGQT